MCFYVKRIVCKVVLEIKLSILVIELLLIMVYMYDFLLFGCDCMIYEILFFIKVLINGDKCDICLVSFSLYKICYLLLCGNNIFYI